MASGKTASSKYDLLDTAHSLVKSFIKRVKPGEWRSLQLGAPDEETKIKMAELLLDFISLASAALLTYFRNLKEVSERRVVSNLNTSLPQIFAGLLDVKVQCRSSDELTALIVKDITENINSALSSHQDSEEPILSRVTPACRLAVMVQYACKILKPHGSKVKLFLVQPRREVCPCIKAKFAKKHAEPATELSQTVKTNVSMELNKITKPLLYDMSNPEFKQLQAETSLDVNTFADDIAQLVSKEVGLLAETDSCAKEKHLQCVQRAEDKIKTFFAKRFTKASILNTVAKLRTEFDPKSKQETKSVRSLMHSIDNLLLTETSENQEGIGVFKKFKRISSGKIPTFTQALGDLIYRHIRQSRRPDVTMLAAIRAKVLCCLGLTSWWLKTTISHHSENVTFALKGTEPRVVVQLPEVIPVQVIEPLDCGAAESAPECETPPVTPTTEATAVTETRKWCIRMFIEKFIGSVLRKSKVRMSVVTIQAIIKRLFEKTWAEVEDIDFKDSKDTFKKIEKSIFKELVKKCGSEQMVINSIKTENPEIDNYISSSVRRHITQPKKPRTISKVFAASSRVGFI